MKWDSFRPANPTALNENQLFDRRAFLAKNVMLSIDHVTGTFSKFADNTLTQWFVRKNSEVFENAAEAMCSISFVEGLTEHRQLPKESERGSRHLEHRSGG